jgi:MFS transporter, ACS family, tartrate transporter
MTSSIPIQRDPYGVVGRRTVNKIFKRILPFMMALYLVNVLDRVNLGYAALDMNKELAISATAFGTLVAAFFVGYFIFEVPSNIILEKVGSRQWIARIMVTWGIVTCLVFFAQSFTHIYTLRVLLGIMEAGFFPGIIFYFTLWFPAKERAWAISLFFVGAQAGIFIGSPMATWIMDNVTWLGASGWRWVFMVEGIPAIILGIIAWFYLTNRPQEAKWLTQEEKDWIVGKLADENRLNRSHNAGIWAAFKSVRVWHLAAIYFFFQVSAQAIGFWIPTITKGFASTFSNTTIGLILMAPPAFAIIAMTIWGKHSDKTGERKWHIIIPILASVIGLGIALVSDNVALKILGVILAAGASPMVYGVFWALPARYIQGATAAVGIAIINSCSSAAGFVGNSVLGAITSTWGSAGSLVFLGISFLLAVVLTLRMNMHDVALTKDVELERQTDPVPATVGT